MDKGQIIKNFVEEFMELDLLSFINSILMKESHLLIYHSILNDLNDKEKIEIEQRTNGLRSYRDHRTPIQYYQNIVCSWIIEECVKRKLANFGYKILNYGSDNEREIFSDSKKIKNDSDILIEFENNIFKKIEITNDYTNYVYNNNKYAFRYNKYGSIKKDNSYILHLSLDNRSFVFFNINEIKDLQYIPEYFPFGNKPVYLAELNDNFHSLKDLKEIMLEKIKTHKNIESKKVPIKIYPENKRDMLKELIRRAKEKKR